MAAISHLRTNPWKRNAVSQSNASQWVRLREGHFRDGTPKGAHAGEQVKEEEDANEEAQSEFIAAVPK
jgi:hypothetical protein